MGRSPKWIVGRNWRTLKKDFNEEFSDTVKVGIVTAMMPASVQELVYQSFGAKVKYDDVIQKIRAVISNKVAMMEGSGPAPMDVGEVWNQGGPEDEEPTEVTWERAQELIEEAKKRPKRGRRKKS